MLFSILFFFLNFQIIIFILQHFGQLKNRRCVSAAKGKQDNFDKMKRKKAKLPDVYDVGNTQMYFPCV